MKSRGQRYPITRLCRRSRVNSRRLNLASVVPISACPTELGKQDREDSAQDMATVPVEESSHAVAQLLLDAQELERNRIGRDLHDSVGQEIALLGVRLQNLVSSGVVPSDEIASEISNLVDQTERIGKLIREISHDLYPAKLQYLGLPIAVQSFCREFSTVRKIDIRCRCNADCKVDAQVALAVYRVLQEALRNIAKHSQSKAARVDLCCTDHEVILKVKDFGKGFDASNPKFRSGLGIISMRERVYSRGGSITISSTRCVGTCIEARFPIPSVMEHRSLA